jgi:uncharacterized membrane protein YuzA (DUF378 family)
MKKLHSIAFILLIIGGINWLLEGAIMWGIGSFLPEVVARIIYVLVGISAVYLIFDHRKTCKECVSESAAPASMPM